MADTPSLPQATSIDPINKSIPPNPNQSPSNKALLPPRPKLSYTPEVDDRIRLSSRRPYDPRDDHRRDYDHEYDRERYLDDRERYHDDRSRARDRDRDRDCRERERDRGRHRSRSRSRSRSRGRDREWERETERRSIRPPYPLHERISERDWERERSRRYSRSPPPGCGSSRISPSSSHRRRLSPSVACPPGYPYDRRDDRDLRTSLDCDYRPPLDRRDFDRYEPRRNLVRGDDYERRRDEEYERRREEEYERRKREDWHAHRSRRSPSPPRLRHSPSPAKRPSVTLSSLVPPVPRSPPPPPRARLASPSRSHSPSGYYLPVYPPGRSPSRLRPYSRSRSPSSSRSPPKLHYHPRSPPPGPSQAIQSRSPSNALSKACPPTLSASHQTSLPSSSRMKVFQQSLSLPTQTHPARVVSESYLSRSPSPSSVLSPRETRSASPPSVQAKVQSFTDNLPPKSYVVTRKALASSLDMTRESDAQTFKQTVLKQARAVSKIPSQDISPGPDTSTKETSHIPHPDSLVQNDSISGSPVVGQSAHQANHDGSIFSVHRISPDERSSHLTSSADNHSRPTTTDYHLTTGPRSYRAHDHESSETDRKRQKMMGSPYDRSSLPSAPQSPRPSLTEDVAPSSSRQLLKPPPARNTVIVDPSSERTLISSSARKDVEHSSTRASYPTSSSVHTRSLPTHSSTAVKIPPSIPTGPRAGVPIGPRAWASQKLTKAPVTSIRTSPPPQNISPKSYRDSAGMTSGSTRLPRSDHYPHSAPFPSADALSGPPLNTPASEVFMSPLPVSIPITIPPPAPPPPPPNHPRASNNSLSEAKSSFNVRSNTPIPTPSGSNSPVTTFGKQPTLNVVSSTPAANQIAKSSITANGLGLRKDSIGGIASSSSSGSAPSIPITTATPAASSSTQVRVNNYPGGKLHPSTQAYGSVGGNYVGSNGMSGNNQPHVGATVQVSPPVIDRDLERAQRMCEVCPSLEQEIAKLRSTRNSSMLASHLNCKVASEKTLAELKYQMIEMKVLSERRKLAEAQLDRHGGGISLAMGF